MSQLDGNPRLAVAISLAHAHNSYLISASQIYCFKKSEIIYDHAVQFLVSKNFPYASKLNKFIEMASEGGLINKWYSKARISALYKYGERVNGQVSMEELYGGLMIWGIAVMSPIFSFLLEIVVHKRARARNSSRFWMRAELLINADRHFWLETKWR